MNEGGVFCKFVTLVGVIFAEKAHVFNAVFLAIAFKRVRRIIRRAVIIENTAPVIFKRLNNFKVKIALAHKAPKRDVYGLLFLFKFKPF